jgi:hypothetical protein
MNPVPSSCLRACLAALFGFVTAARADTFSNLGLAIRLSGPAQVEVSWDTATNAGYRLEYCSTLSSNAWTPVCSVPGDGQRCCTNDPLLSGEPRYYRVALSPAGTHWKTLFGGSGDDYGQSVCLTRDGGYVVGGVTISFDGDGTGNHGYSDGLVLKVDANGVAQWAGVLGGTHLDGLNSVKQTADGGYVCAGYTRSNDGEVSGNHGGYDAWLVKLGTNGAIQWQKCFGGTADDGFSSVEQTGDGGYVAAGWTESQNGDVSGNHGFRDAWVVKTDASGNSQWRKCFGGSDYDEARQVQETADGGYVFAGYTYSQNGDVSGYHGGEDGWIVKLNTNGVIEWERVMGGTNVDEFWSVQQTQDGGYVAAGVTYSGDGDITLTNTNYDGYGWVVKLDGSGNTQWQKFIGGGPDAQFRSVCQTSDGGYLATGLESSIDVFYDLHVCKLGATGELQWRRRLGGSGTDYGHAVRQASDGGYIVVGETTSLDGDIDPAHAHGDFDIWVIKLLPNGQ